MPRSGGAAVMRMSYLLAHGGSEKAAWFDQEHEDQQGEDVHIRERGGVVPVQEALQVHARELLNKSDQEAADGGAADVADAADHRGDEGFEPQENPGLMRGLL